MFPMNSPINGTTFKIVLSQLTDTYGRVILYDLDLIGVECEQSNN